MCILWASLFAWVLIKSRSVSSPMYLMYLLITKIWRFGAFKTFPDLFETMGRLLLCRQSRMMNYEWMKELFSFLIRSLISLPIFWDDWLSSTISQHTRMLKWIFIHIYLLLLHTSSSHSLSLSLNKSDFLYETYVRCFKRFFPAYYYVHV